MLRPCPPIPGMFWRLAWLGLGLGSESGLGSGSGLGFGLGLGLGLGSGLGLDVLEARHQFIRLLILLGLGFELLVLAHLALGPMVKGGEIGGCGGG